MAENLLDRQFHADKPNQKSLTDVTEFKWYEGMVSAILDLYDRRIVAYASGTGTITLVFKTFDKALKRCTSFADGTDLYLTEDDHYIPDFMVVCAPDKIKSNGVHGVPDLVAEVLSPGTVKYDRGYKKEVYAKCGVQEYWLVSPGDKTVEVYRTDGIGFVLHDIYALHADWEQAQMSEEERAAVVTHFKCSLFDDLDISLEDIFYHTF